MNTTTAVPALVELRAQLEARTNEFANALPSHIKPEHFQRVTLTAISLNPKLLNVDRRSLFNELMRCAQDGLIPDGRQAVLVIYKDRERGTIAKYQQMIAGVRMLVQQSGEVTRFEQTVVYANDEFSYRLGDRPHISHKPAIDNRGDPIIVYSIAEFRDGGALSREVMTVEEIEKARAVSRSKDDGPWVQWWGEMARKTVAKRHAKVLPMSNDARAALARDDEADGLLSILPSARAPARTRPRLTQQLDAISAPNDDGAEQPRRRRGRPSKHDGEDATEATTDAAPPSDEPPAESASQLPDDEQLDLIDGDTIEAEGPGGDGWPGPDIKPSPDYERGRKDRQQGRAACLDRAIRDTPARFKEWTRGFEAAG
jgi:recombination protein RecT